MKSVLPILFCCAALCVSSRTASGQGAFPSMVSPAEAIKIVRDVVRDPAIVLKISNMPRPEGPIPAFYTIETDSWVYHLRSDTRAYLSWTLPKKREDAQPDPTDPTEAAARVLPEADLRQRAVEYMRSYYPDPARLNKIELQKTGGWSDGKGGPVFVQTYTYRFTQEMPNGAQGPSSCSVNIETLDGSVSYYAAWTQPVLISPIPALSRDQAMAVATQTLATSAEPIQVDRLFFIGPDAFGLQRLCYALRFVGELKTGRSGPGTYGVGIDANSGEVLSLDLITGLATKSAGPPKPVIHAAASERILEKRLTLQWGGRTLATQYPPLNMHDRPYLCADYLLMGRPDRKLQRGQQQLTFADAAHVWTMQIGKREYICDGKPRKMSAPPLLINGKYYVPLDILTEVTGYKAQYQAKTKTVCVELPGT